MEFKKLTPLMLAALLAACGGDDNDNKDNGPQAVTINFAAKVGSADLTCGENTTMVGTANSGNGSLPIIKDFRLYISSVQVAGNDGEFVNVELDQNDWQHQNVALLDFEDGSATCSSGTTATHNSISGKIPAGEYTQLRFTLGVPQELNHLDRTTAPSPLNIDGMTWSWAGGYKHARMDVAGWNIHLGTTGCTLDSNNENLDCSADRPNRPTYTFNNFSADSVVTFDYAELVSTSDITSNANGALGCMSGETDAECAPLFSKMGLDITSGECAADGCDSQSWITLE